MAPAARGQRTRGPVLLLLPALLLGAAAGLFGARLQCRAGARGQGRPGSSSKGPAFVPTGYALPPECAKHSVLYGQIFSDLAPWFDTGISEEDLEACGSPLGTTDP